MVQYIHTVLVYGFQMSTQCVVCEGQGETNGVFKGCEVILMISYIAFRKAHTANLRMPCHYHVPVLIMVPVTQVINTITCTLKDHSQLPETNVYTCTKSLSRL